MTFSRIAVLTKAREAIIHKEFHLSSADRRLVGEKGYDAAIVSDIEAKWLGAALTEQSVSMVSVIGSDVNQPELVPRALMALADAGIGMVAMQQQIRNVDVQFIVGVEDFDPAVRVLHKALVESVATAPERAAA